MNLYKAQTRFLFHAHIKIKIPLFTSEAFFDVLFGILEEVDRKYNSYQPDSYIDRINRNAGEWTEADEETVNLLRETIRWSQFFQGAFDITIMPLIRLWGFYRNEGLTVPTRQSIEETLKRVDYRRIEIDGSRVRIGKDQEIITGSFLKAYAVDKMVAAMRREGIDDAIVNAGGSTICALNNGSHRIWTVNVRECEDDEPLFKLKLSNGCYSTSSQENTFVDIDGKRYGHILNPTTGMPSTNRQVGILTDNCMEGDILSTGLFLQDLKGFAERMEELKKIVRIDGFMTDGDGNLYKTPDFGNYLTK